MLNDKIHVLKVLTKTRPLVVLYQSLNLKKNQARIQN